MSRSAAAVRLHVEALAQRARAGGALGRPRGAVFARHAGTVEAVRAGETGWLAAVEDPAGWVGAVREIIGDEVGAARVQRAARAWVEEEFDAHRNAAKLRKVFREAMR